MEHKFNFVIPPTGKIQFFCSDQNKIRGEQIKPGDAVRITIEKIVANPNEQ